MTRFKTSVMLIASLLAFSCNTETVKEKAESTINNTGKSIGRGTKEFIKGVKEGVDKTLQCSVETSPSLKSSGLKIGKFYISESNGASDNILTAYLIFDQDFSKKILVKVFDKNGREYGRTSTDVEGRSGEAYNISFVFDPSTDIEAGSKFVMQ